MENINFNIFIDRLSSIINNQDLVKLIISKKRNKSSDLKKITVTVVKLKRGIRLNFIYNHETNDITKNFEINEGLEIIMDTLNNTFFNADIFSKTENISFISSRKGNSRIKITEPTLFTVDSLNHDNIKKRFIETKDNIYLKELGITKPNGEVYHKMIDKYKQINRYIELLAPRLEELDLNNDFHIVDMGSGKGYLTFALYDYISNSLKNKVKMTGVEFRDNLVAASNEISNKANFSNLKFIQGTIEKARIDNIDILIALHACDTATDEAIFRGIKSNSTLIVCAPCCHKQIRKEMSIDNELSSIVKHGILKERQAEIITDTLRAMIMEFHGYRTSIFEFISTEHTPKNLMIVGKKSTISTKKKEEIIKNIDSIKKLFGIKQHYLEKLLNMK